MADFKRPDVPEFKKLHQDEVRVPFSTEQALAPDRSPVEGPSLADQIVDSYDKTIDFMKWVESLMDDQLKDVSVTIDPEQQPEVWMAMTRIFANPSVKIDYNSFAAITRMLEEAEDIEYAEEDPQLDEDKLIAELNGLAIEDVDDSALADEITREDIEDLEDFTQVKTFHGLTRKERKERRRLLHKIRKKLRWYTHYLKILTISPDQDSTNAIRIQSAKQKIALLTDLVTKIQNDQDVSQDEINGILKE